MSSLVERKNKSNLSLQFKTEYSDYLNPYNKSNSIYFRDTIKQFCPHQRYVDHRPHPYRSFVKPPSDFNYFNNPTEKDSFVPCFKNYPKRELLPLVTRQDLAKYLKNNGKLISHKRPCNSCSRINYGNYGRNYYTIEHKSFPFINGNFTGTNFRVTNGFSTIYQTRNDRKRRLRYKIKNYDNNKTNEEFNNEYYENQKNYSENKNQSNINRNNFYEGEYFGGGATPNYKRRFNKTQIFNHYKPFMVDDFKEFADYE